MLAAQEHRFDDAWRDVITCQRMARPLWECGSLMESLVGVAVASTSGNLITQLLSLEAAEEKELIARWQELAVSMSSEPRLDRIVLFDRMMVAELQLLFRAGREQEVTGSGPGKSQGLWHSFKSRIEESAYQTVLNKWDINASLEYSSDHFDEVEQAFALPSYRQRTAAWAQLNSRLEGDLEAERKSAMSAYMRGNNAPLAEYWKTALTRMFMPSHAQLDAALTRHRQRRILYHAAFVAVLHRRKTGQPPGDGLELQQFARQYALDAKIDCPDLIDLYTEEPLRLKRDAERLVIYACGQNFVDDDGTASEDTRTGDVPVTLDLR
jgi:hypothetical protein